jgi:hypothetical protein
MPPGFKTLNERCCVSHSDRVGGAASVAWWQASKRRPHPMYFHTSVPFPANDLALSPDRRILAMVAYSAQGKGFLNPSPG